VDRGFLMGTLQALGRLDVRLMARDERFVAGEGYIEEGVGLLEFDDHLTQSYLWVLGAYELVRTLHAREPKQQNGKATPLQTLYRRYSRLRVPLAKMMPARYHKLTDFRIAYPALNYEFGVAWQVAETTFISRGELSNEFLSVLEGAAT